MSDVLPQEIEWEGEAPWPEAADLSCKPVSRAASGEEEQADRPPLSHSWTPVDLVALKDVPPPKPTIGGLLYSGRRHVFSGEPDALKSWAALALAVDEAQAGRTVVVVECGENGRHIITERLYSLGADDNEVRRVAYIEPAEPLDDPAVRGDVEALLEHLQPSLVILDSFDALLGLHGLDSHSTVDVERFYRTIVGLLQKSGAAVLLLDHVTKDREKRGRYAIGSQRKIGAADVALGFENVRPFSRGGSGLSRIVVHKDRLGYLSRPTAAELELTSDADTGRVTWTLRPSRAAGGGEDSFRPTRIMEKVSKFLEARVAEETPSLNAIELAKLGKADYVRMAIDLLVGEGFVEETPGPRKARLFRSVNPYREDADADVF